MKSFKTLPHQPKFGKVRITAPPLRGFFYAYFFIKKIWLPECRSFSSSEVPPSSYTFIITDHKFSASTFDTTHNIFFKCTFCLNMFIIGYSKGVQMKLTSQQIYEIVYKDTPLKTTTNNNPRCPYPRRKIK